MKYRKYISSGLIRTINYILMFVFLVITMTGMTNAVMNRLMKKAEETNYESYKNILNGYTKAVNVKLQSYKNIVDIFNYEPLLSTASSSEIQKYLASCINKRPSDILCLIYVDKDGNGFTDAGRTFHLDEKNYYFNDDFAPQRYYIGDASQDPNGHYPPVFTIMEPVYDEKRNLKGSLCAIIPISIFNSIFESQNSESSILVTLQDSSKRFIYTKNKNMLMHPPVIKDSDYTVYEKQYIRNEEIFSLSGKLLDGREFDFLVSDIANAKWLIALSIPHEIRKTFQHQMRLTKIGILFSIVFLIGVMIIANSKIQKIITRKQLIEANFDPLTGVPTIDYFEKHAAKHIKKHKNLKYMIVECDIKNFKFINQKYGKNRADEVLVLFGHILNAGCNEFKGWLGRGYADHFSMMFRINSPEHALEKFKVQLAEFNEKIKACEIAFFPSFGISFYKGKESIGESIQSLIGQATFAKNSNKNNLVQNYAVYDSKLVEQVEEELYFEENMKTALEKGEFFVMYQPKLDLTTEKLCGAEALVRWNSPKLGLVGPDRFIPVFEKNGFITKLDFYVYEQVFIFLQNCIDNNIPTVRISLNMSRKHADSKQFMKKFLELFHKYSIPADLLEIEILERSVMDSVDLTTIVDMLHKEGFSVAMDDFGSGESSLNMLTKIPVDVLKFDREFLLSKEGQHLDESTKKFIKTLVNLGKNLNKLTLFEGVETEEQRDFLKSIKCDLAQGFLYSRPLYDGDFVNFVKRNY